MGDNTLPRLPGESAREYLLRSRRHKAQQEKQRRKLRAEDFPHLELLPFQKRYGRHFRHHWVNPPAPDLVAVSMPGWHDGMAGLPAVWQPTDHQPRGAVIEAPCPFTHYIRVRTADTHRVVYAPPEELFIEKGQFS